MRTLSEMELNVISGGCTEEPAPAPEPEPTPVPEPPVSPPPVECPPPPECAPPPPVCITVPTCPPPKHGGCLSDLLSLLLPIC